MNSIKYIKGTTSDQDEIRLIFQKHTENVNFFSYINDFSTNGAH